MPEPTHIPKTKPVSRKPRAQPQFRLELRLLEFDRITRARGWTNDFAIAHGVGMDPATIFRIRKGRTPGHHFVAAVLHALPEADFYRLFDIATTVDTDDQT